MTTVAKKETVAERLARMTGMSGSEAVAKEQAKTGDTSYFHQALGAIAGLIGGGAIGDVGEIGALLKAGNSTPNSMKPAAPATPAAGPNPNDLFGTAAPAAGAAPGGDFNTLMSALFAQESSGRAGVSGPATPYGTAQGMGQMLPATAEGVAKQHGIAWNPALMTDTSPAGAAYQQQLSTLHMQDLLKGTGGDVGAALGNYFAGPNPALHGPKTAAYVDEVLGRMGQTQPGTPPPFTMPGLSFVDPKAAMGMVPDPVLNEHIALPNAPHQAALPDAPQHEQLDPTTLLAGLKAAMAPVPQAAPPTKMELIQGLLAGAAHGLQGVDPTAGLGDFILGGGLGVGEAKAKQTADAKALTQKQAEDQRAVDVAMAKAGLDMNMSNVGTRNDNADLKYKHGVDQGTVDYSNATGDFNTTVQQLLANAGIDQGNVAAKNNAANTRSTVGLNALQQGASTQNTTAVGAANASTDLTKLLLGSDGNFVNPAETNAYTKANLDPKTFRASKDPVYLNANQVASAIASKNIPGALGGLANEMLLNGHYAEVLGDADAKKVKQLVQNKDAHGAAAVISDSLTKAMSDPATRAAAIEIIDNMAKGGQNPAAQLISGNIARGTPAQR